MDFKARKTVEQNIGSHDAKFSIVVFAISTASLVLFEIVIGQVVAPAGLADWAYARSMIFIGAGLSARGFDQALLRRQVNYSNLKMPILLQVSLLSLVVVIPAIAILDLKSAFLVYLATASLSFLIVTGGLLRSGLKISFSIAAIHGWKLFLLLGGLALLVIVGDLWPLLIATAVLVLAVIISVPLVGLIDRSSPRSEHKYRDLLAVANHFWITNLIALGFIYVDQLVLNLDGRTSESAAIFLYGSLVLPIPMFVAGFAANLINPWLRCLGEDARRQGSYLAVVYVAGAFVTVAMGLTMGMALGVMLGRFEDGIDLSVVVGLGIISLVRMLYVPASATVGIFGTLSELKIVAVAGALSILAMVITYFTLTRAIAMSPVDAILVAMIAASSIRLLASSVLGVRLVRDPGRSLAIDLYG